MRSLATRPTHRERIGHCCGREGSKRSFPNHRTSKAIVSGADPRAAGHRNSTRSSTRAAMSSSAVTPACSSGEGWPPDMTNSPSSTEQLSCSTASSPGYSIYQTRCSPALNTPQSASSTNFTSSALCIPSNLAGDLPRAAAAGSLSSADYLSSSVARR